MAAMLPQLKINRTVCRREYMRWTPFEGSAIRQMQGAETAYGGLKSR